MKSNTLSSRLPISGATTTIWIDWKSQSLLSPSLSVFYWHLSDNEYLPSSNLVTAHHTWNLITYHENDLFQLQKRPFEFFGSVKVYYHLHCLKYPDISGDNEYLPYAKLMTERHAWNLHFYHSDVPLQQKNENFLLLHHSKFIITSIVCNILKFQVIMNFTFCESKNSTPCSKSDPLSSWSPFQLQKQPFELIWKVKVYYHLHFL